MMLELEPETYDSEGKLIINYFITPRCAIFSSKDMLSELFFISKETAYRYTLSFDQANYNTRIKRSHREHL